MAETRCVEYDELCWPHPNDSLRPCLTMKVWRHPAGSSYPWCTLELLLSGLRPGSGIKFKPVSIWSTPFAPTWWLTENLPHVTHIPQEDLSVTEPNRQLASGGKQTQISGCLVPLADLSPGLVLVESSFGAQVGPSHTHPGQAEIATNCGKLQNCCLLTCTRVPPNRPKTNIPSARVKTSDQQWMS